MKKTYKSRRVCDEPYCFEFHPVKSDNENSEIIMTVDEYETIRLIDLENLSQEECAGRMGIARTTAQMIYNNARKKLAEVLVFGHSLKISGGNYILCSGENPGCNNCDMNKITLIKSMKEKEKGTMRIAVTYENGQVFQHFGRSEAFKVYDIDNDKIVSSEVIGTNGQGHGALAGVLSMNQIDVLICGGIGGGAQSALANAGIELCAGASGDADEAVKAYLAGKLVNTGSNCDHHHHEDGHACGDHGCGDHGCGSHGCH
jgi:predicted DNA-binding protein (UPF0251 family)/predicted Fe-Mo cluster-binding NifX family protein